MTKQTDNKHLAAKLELRRHFLNRYHGTGLVSVFDACQGEKVVWTALEKEFKGRLKYWGVDKKHKAGRLVIESERVLQIPGWTFDVIDVDTYGSPWKHWLSLLPRVSKPVTVFLTIGAVRFIGFGTRLSREVLEIAAPKFRAGVVVPKTLVGRLAEHFNQTLISQAYKYGLDIDYAAEAEVNGNARYIGLRLLKGPVKK